MSASTSHARSITAEMLKPRFVDGRWRRPVVQAMELARARKAALVAQQPFPFPKAPNARRDKPLFFKGHKHELNATRRADRIADAMKEMPARIADYYKQLHARREIDTQATRLLGKEAGAVAGKKEKKQKKAKAETT